MARPLRIQVSDGWYHVTARGIERRAIFTDGVCCRHFLDLLQEVSGRYRVKVHAFVLMPNHFHLVLSTPEANLSAAMQWLKTSYGMWFNRRAHRVGPLFQGRYKAELFEGRVQAWPITRYVHLNPVRVGALGLGKSARRREAMGGINVGTDLVRRRQAELRTFPWSSYSYYVGTRKPPVWLAADEVLNHGHVRRATEQQRAYRAYVESVLGAATVESPLKMAEGGLLLGGAEWAQRMKRRLRGDVDEQRAYRHLRPRPRWEEIRRAIERVRDENWVNFADRYGDWGRDLAMHVLRVRGGATLREAARCVGIAHYQTAAQALQRLKRRLETDKTLRARLAEVEQCINI
jgi:putative transposase